jgi:hypothetical protein
MGLKLDNLDDRTRALMVAEIDRDIAANRLYLSPRLNGKGQVEYPSLIKQASFDRSDTWLSQQLRVNHLLNPVEQRRRPKGGFTMVRVPETAPDTLAEGELNRYYIRAVCVRAIEDGIESVEVYRAKAVAAPRRESQMLIGEMVDPHTLLADLRTNTGVDTALGLPGGPNSGLSVRLPMGRGSF